MEKHVLDELSTYLDGELSSEDEVRVALHLENCASCNEVYEELSAVSLILGERWPSMELSSDMNDRIWLSIQREEKRRETKVAWMTTGSLAVSVLLLTGFFVFSPWGMIVSRVLYLFAHWLFLGLEILSAVVSVTPIVAGGSLLASVFLLIGSVWGVRKLVTGISTGGMV